MSDKLTFNGVLDEMNADNEPSEAITFMERLRDSYVPTIEMTQEDKNTLGYYLENSTFFSLIERKHAGIEVEMLGITGGTNEFLNLSDEDLMQAWLHSETVEVID